MIRLAADDDLPLLHDLAELDSAGPLAGAVLLALVEGAPWAAIALQDGRTIADPFRPSAGVAELLRVRRAQLQARPLAAVSSGRSAPAAAPHPARS